MNLSSRLIEVINKKSRRIIGLMSGMSMDGVDLACIDVSGDFPNLKVSMQGTYYRPYSNEFRLRLKSAINANVGEVSELNVLISQEFSQTVKDFLSASGMAPASIDAIGSHGQTLYHAESSLQVGSPSIIAELTGILTIANFRVRDICAGGKGAPLVSLADYILYRSDVPVALNNLGSISNVTVVTPRLEEMMAFDTGPANMPIDYFLKGVDKDGLISAQGNVIDGLLHDLMQISFFQQSPPKAAGYKEFGPDTLAKISAPYCQNRVEDLAKTAVEFSAQTLATAYRDFVLPRFPSLKRASFSGGGVHNKTLMKRIKELLPEIEVVILEKEIADAKEAIAFAILANETLSGRAGSIPALTGVSKPIVLGEVGL